MRGRVSWMMKGAGFAGMAIAFVFVFGWVVMSLWNWLVPALFHGPAIGYWQALGLLVLSRILFGSLRGRGGWHGHWRSRMWRERWASMTPEERERLRAQFRARCGRHRQGEAAPESPPT